MIKYSMTFLLSFVLCVGVFAQTIKPEEAKSHVGKTVTVCGKIFNGRFLKSAKNRPTLLNMGGAFPNHHLTVVIFEEDLKQFPNHPENYYANTEACVTGSVIEYNGKPEIVARIADQIKIVPIVGGVGGGVTKTNTGGKTTPIDTPVQTKNVQPKTSGYQVTLSNDVNLRAGGGIDYPSLAILKAGTVISISSSSKGWSFVSVVKNDNDEKTNGLQGYIKNSVLK